jgi:outer membrane protein W
MMKRCHVLAVFAALSLIPAAASAQIHQVGSATSSRDGKATASFTVGFFGLRGYSGRPVDDILYQDLQPPQPLLFDVSDLNGVPVGGEFVYGFTRHIEAGVGVTYYSRTAHSVYANLTHADNSEIMQDLKLKQTTESFTGRYLFLPRGSTIEPYVGAGVVAIKYNYSEAGEFVDATDLTVFPAQYQTDGTVVGPLIIAGARGHIGGRFIAGGEFRWQKATADVPIAANFLGTKLDLSGWGFNFNFGVRF